MAARGWWRRESARAVRASTTSARRSSTCTRSGCATRTSSASSTLRSLCAKMAAMNPDLWPARLHHLRRDSPKPEPLARFYGELLGDRVAPLPDGSWLVAGRNRRLVIGEGQASAVPYFALEMHDATQLVAYRRELKQAEDFASPLLAPGAFAVRDPDGRRVAFGV